MAVHVYVCVCMCVHLYTYCPVHVCMCAAGLCTCGNVYSLACWLSQVGEVMTDLGRSHSMRDRDDLLAEQVSSLVLAVCGRAWAKMEGYVGY